MLRVLIYYLLFRQPFSLLSGSISSSVGLYGIVTNSGAGRINNSGGEGNTGLGTYTVSGVDSHAATNARAAIIINLFTLLSINAYIIFIDPLL